MQAGIAAIDLLGSIPEGLTKLISAVEYGETFLVARERAVVIERQTHRAESHGWYFWAILTQWYELVRHVGAQLRDSESGDGVGRCLEGMSFW